MVKKLSLLILILIGLPAFGLGKLQGYVEQGGQAVSVVGFKSTTNVQRSYPSAGAYASAP